MKEKNGLLALSSMGRSVLKSYDSIKSWNNEMLLFYSSMNDFIEMLKSGYYQETLLSEYWVYKKSPEPNILYAHIENLQ